MMKVETPVKSTKELRPKFRIKAREKTVKKFITIKESYANLLADYARFSSEYDGGTIDEDQIVDRLFEGLAKDRAFKAWRKKGAV